MNRKLLTQMFAGGNLGVSVAMSILVAFIPFAYEGIDPSILGPDGRPVIISLSAIDVNGLQIVPLLFAHSAAAAYFFYLVARDPSKMKMPRTTVYLFVAAFVAYAAISFDSFGLFFIPSAGLSLLAAVVFSTLDFPDPEPLPPPPIAKTNSPGQRRRRSGRRRGRRQKK
ncbi:MAG: hypothetical protein IIC93_00445 [Chloroflexi bacterium]|nr:hypothetical protein [Chloroflexota bacterium]